MSSDSDERVKRRITKFKELLGSLLSEPAGVVGTAAAATQGSLGSAGAPQDAAEAQLASRVATALQQLVDEVTSRSGVREEWLCQVLKVVDRVAREYPAVLDRGNAQVVLPLLARVCPTLARPRASSASSAPPVAAGGKDAHTAAVLAADALLAALHLGDPEVHAAAMEDMAALVRALPDIAQEVVHPMPPPGSRERAVASVAATTSVHCLERAEELLRERQGMPCTQPATSSRDAAEERAAEAARQVEEAGGDLEAIMMAMGDGVDSAIEEANMQMSAGPPQASAVVELPSAAHWQQLTVAAIKLFPKMASSARDTAAPLGEGVAEAMAALVAVGDVAVTEACLDAAPTVLAIVGHSNTAGALACSLAGAALSCVRRDYAAAQLPAFRTKTFDDAVARCLDAALEHDQALEAHGAAVLDALPWSAAATLSPRLAASLCAAAEAVLSCPEGAHHAPRALGLLPLLKCGAHAASIAQPAAQALARALQLDLGCGDQSAANPDARPAKRARVCTMGDLRVAVADRLRELACVDRHALCARKEGQDYPGKLLELAVLGEAAVKSSDDAAVAAVTCAVTKWCEETSRLAASGGAPCARRTATLLLLVKNSSPPRQLGGGADGGADRTALVRMMPALAEEVLKGSVSTPGEPTVQPPGGGDGADVLSRLAKDAASLSVASGAIRLIWSVPSERAVEAAKALALAALCTVDAPAAEHCMNVALRDRSAIVRSAAIAMAAAGWAAAAAAGDSQTERAEQRERALHKRLLRLSEDASEDVRAIVAATLPSWAPMPAQWGAVARKLLCDGSAIVQAACISSLSSLLKDVDADELAGAGDAIDASMELLALLRSSDDTVRSKASATCARLALPRLVVVLRPSGVATSAVDAAQEQAALLNKLRSSLHDCDTDASRDAHLSAMCAAGLVMAAGEPLNAVVGELMLHLDGGPHGVSALADRACKLLGVLAAKRDMSVLKLVRSACASPSVARLMCRAMLQSGRENLIPKVASVQQGAEEVETSTRHRDCREVVARMADAYLPHLIDEGGMGDPMVDSLLPVFAQCARDPSVPEHERDIPNLLKAKVPAIASHLLMRSQETMEALKFLGQQLPDDENAPMKSEPVERAFELFAEQFDQIVMHMVWNLGELTTPEALASDVRNNLEPIVSALVDMHPEMDEEDILRTYPESGLVNEWELLPGVDNASQRSAESMDIDDARKRRALAAGVLAGRFLSLWEQLERKYRQPVHRTQALRCICALVGLVGSHIAPFASKVLIFLTDVLERSGREEDALHALRMLVVALGGASPSSLCALASQIVVALLPPLERAAEGSRLEQLAVRAVEELLIGQGAHVKGALKSMPGLPVRPALDRARDALIKARGEPASLASRLVRLIHGLGHESAAVRTCILSEVRAELVAHRDEAASLARKGDPAMRRLVARLLRSMGEQAGAADRRGRSTEGASAAMLTCAECLGLTGAIDRHKMADVELRATHWKELAPVDFLQQLIEHHLARSLRAGQAPLVFSAAAYATQTVFEVTGLRDGNAPLREISQAGALGSQERDSLCSTGEELWERLSSDVKEIVGPCRSSLYQLAPQKEARESPVWREDMPYLAWLYAWYRSLLPMVVDERALLFSALAPLAKVDARVALFALPQLSLAALTGSRAEDARRALAAEFVAVLKSCEESGSDIATMAAEAVFHIWDGLLRWVERLRRGEDAHATARTHSIATTAANVGAHRARATSDLLGDVPNLLLAKASLRCGSPARALMYAELHVRRVIGTNNPSSQRGGMNTHVRHEESDIALLARVQASLESPDGIRGVAALRRACGALSEGGLEEAEEALLLAEAEGDWSEAALLCESALAREGGAERYRGRLLSCMLQAGKHHSVLAQVEGMAARGDTSLHEHGVAAAWRLGQWDALERHLPDGGAEGGAAPFEAALGRTLLAVHRREEQAVEAAAVGGRAAMCTRLAAAAMESYDRAHPYLVRLHMLQEVVDGCTLARGLDALPGEGNSMGGSAPQYEQAARRVEGQLHWGDRLALTEDSLAARFPVLELRGSLLHECGRPARAAEAWLEAAKLARKASRKDVARAALLQVDALRRTAIVQVGRQAAAIELEVLAGRSTVEGAKLAWSSGRQVEAASMLEGWLARSSDAAHRSLAAAAVAAAGGAAGAAFRAPFAATASVDAKALLLLARWSAATGQRDSRGVTDLLTAAQRAQPKAETAAFEIATYHDDVLRDARARQTNAYAAIGATTKEVAGLTKKETHWGNQLHNVVEWYCKSLQNGVKHVRRSLPRVLTLWLDWAEHGERKYAAEVHGVQAMSAKEARQVAQKLLRTVTTLAKHIPVYYWLTVLSMLASRLAHPDANAAAAVQKLLAKVLEVYPHQALWSIAHLLKSDVPARKEAASKAMTEAKRNLDADDIKALFSSFGQLVDQLIRLCNHKPPPHPTRAKRSVPHFSVRDQVPGLPRLLPVSVIVPLQEALRPTMPVLRAGTTPPDDAAKPTKGRSRGRDAAAARHSPFLLDSPRIQGMLDRVDVMSSLQAPKKVTLKGTDGRDWPFLAKPKDDLRKDLRMMEFAGLLNVLLHRDEASRRRGLQLTTFAVLPLTEDCGLIQWVPHTKGIRHVISDAYGYIGRELTNKELNNIKKEYDSLAQRGMTKTAWLRDTMLPRYPPQLHRYFMRNWPEPAEWLAARGRFARSLAAWSMAGHAVGLGDRHGENILLDEATGNVVMVDFSMLFDKGLELETPERVPFRLTQNLVDALGVEGPQGVFLRASVATLGTLRAHKEEIITVLETLIHDPLVEWSSSRRHGHAHDAASRANAKGVANLKNVEARLNGKVVGVGAAPSLPLSAEGQAQRLIADATAVDNLARMFIWWMPWC